MALRSRVGSPLGIQTLTQLQQANRRLDRLRRDANQTLAAMMNGASLHCSHERGRTIWQLSTGQFVKPEAAAVVTASRDVVDVGDSLFPGLPGQTWRYCDD